MNFDILLLARRTHQSAVLDFLYMMMPHSYMSEILIVEKLIIASMKEDKKVKSWGACIVSNLTLQPSMIAMITWEEEHEGDSLVINHQLSLSTDFFIGILVGEAYSQAARVNLKDLRLKDRIDRQYCSIGKCPAQLLDSKESTIPISMSYPGTDLPEIVGAKTIMTGNLNLMLLALKSSTTLPIGCYRMKDQVGTPSLFLWGCRQISITGTAGTCLAYFRIL